MSVIDLEPVSSLEELCENALAIYPDLTDIHLDERKPPTYVAGMRYVRTTAPVIGTRLIQSGIERLSNAAKEKYLQDQDADGRFHLAGGQTVRMHCYQGEAGPALALRIQPQQVRTYEKTGLPKHLLDLLRERQGLVIFSGPIGSGKTSAMHSMVHEYNTTANGGHIYTIEDPPEYSHTEINCLIHQREIGVTARSYRSAMEGAMRVRPSLILVGEMRRVDEMDATIEIISLGHLAMTSVHAHDTSRTLLRILQSFDPARYNEVREALRNHLLAIVNVRLVPMVDGSLTSACEIMLNNDAIKNNLDDPKNIMLVRDVIQTHNGEGMQTLEYDLVRLENEGRITADTAWDYALRKDDLAGLKSRPSQERSSS